MGWWLLAGVLWAVFANLVNAWLVRPALEEAGIIGLVCVVVGVALGYGAVPAQWKRRALVFTGFAILLGVGWTHLTAGSWVHRLALGALMSAGLAVTAWLAARLRWRLLISTALVLAVLNAWIPIAVWPMLTHFWVRGSGNVELAGGDFPAAPLQVVDEPGGRQALATLTQVHLTPALTRTWLANNHDTPEAFQAATYGLNHLYALGEIQHTSLGFRVVPASASLLTSLSPTAFQAGLFPVSVLQWTWWDGRPLATVQPAVTPGTAASWAAQSWRLPENWARAAASAWQAARDSWRTAVTAAGGTSSIPSLTVDGDVLLGVYEGQTVDVRVPAGSTVVGVGALTGVGRHEALLVGPDELTVVSLDTPGGRVIGSMRWTGTSLLGNDVFIAPLTAEGRDFIYVNTSPAQIWEVDASGRWSRLYTAPNGVFRFETAVRWAAETQPEIIVSDPTNAGDGSVRYLTSYTWRNGQLIRNWRVYWPDFVNVTAFRPDAGGPTYLAGSLYGSGEWLVLQRHFLPLLPISVVLLAGLYGVGWAYRLRQRWYVAPWAMPATAVMAMGITAVAGAVGWRALPFAPTRLAVEELPFPMESTARQPADVSLLETAIDNTAQASGYNYKLTSTVVSGPFHVTCWTYGEVNPPDELYLATQVGNANGMWYQWGPAAFQSLSGTWVSASPVSANPVTSVRSLADMLTAQHASLIRVGTAYVVDENCDVYEAQWSPPVAGSSPLGVGMSGGRAWICIGQTSHALKAVDVRTDIGVSGAGPMAADTYIAFTGLNSATARVQIPPGLLIALQRR